MITEFLKLFIGIPVGIILWKIAFSGVNVNFKEQK